MRRFRDLPIKRKLTLVIMLTCSVVLLLACAAFVGLEYLSSRNELLNTVQTLSSIVADNSTAALAFQNRGDAQRTLQVLEADARINDAALYDREGHVFAAYGKKPETPNSPPPLGYRFTKRELIYVQMVAEVGGGAPLGTLLVRASLDQIYIRLRAYLMVTVAILGLSFLAAWVCATLLRRRIAQPILGLAETTRLVSRENNYAIRAGKYGDDELGELSDSFNRMMARIQHADADLRKSQLRLGLALEAGRIGSWDWDLQANRVFWDEYVPALVGADGQELTPNWDALAARAHPDDRERLRLAPSAIGDSGADLSFSFRIVWSDGSIRYLATRGRVFHEAEGRERRVTGVLIDVTQAKRAEEEARRLNEELEQRVAQRTDQLAQANRELEAFTYSVSHDLRAPLRHINGFAQMLEQQCENELSADAKRLLSRIRFGAKTMGELVDDLLRLARVGRHELMFQPCALQELVTEVVREHRADESGRRIEWTIRDLPVVECDLGLLRQVLTNLIANAVKYTRTRPIAQIEVGSHTTDREHIIFVRDNGVGFDMKYAEKLFGVFQRLHRVEEFEGTGVGLAIVQRIVQKHGGRVWAEGKIDEGACFSFSLPINPIAPA